MPHTHLEIETEDGRCPTHVYHPEGPGPWPGVIVYTDAVGIRPALMEIAERIANDGYYVMLPDVFYRVPYDPSQGLRLFTDPDFRKDLFTRVVPSASHANVMRDTEALLAHMSAQPNVLSDRLGVTGYCMGGRLALYAAGHFGPRIMAAASYHAGGVATDGRSYHRDLRRAARLGTARHPGARRSRYRATLANAARALRRHAHPPFTHEVARVCDPHHPGRNRDR